jgi:undecaprenyl-diphosphatase
VTTADRHLERWVVHHRAGWLDPIFVGLSYLGTDGLIWLGLALVAAVLWRRPLVFLQVAAADVVADLLAGVLKASIHRNRPPVDYPRPEPLVGTPHSGSFPSGHAATSFACAATLAWAAPRLAVPLFVLAAAIAWSRVYVGVHYPLDVVGGAVLGLLVAIALQKLVRALRRSRPARRAG